MICPVCQVDEFAVPFCKTPQGKMCAICAELNPDQRDIAQERICIMMEGNNLTGPVPQEIRVTAFRQARDYLQVTQRKA